jgi:ethanolamine utilization protein EutN
VQLGRVIGTLVATVKDPSIDGVPLLIVQPLDKRQQPSGRPFVAADALRMAGRRELVYWVGAREAAQALEETFAPVDHAIVGIVDAVQPIRIAPQAAARTDPQAAPRARRPRPTRGTRP